MARSYDPFEIYLEMGRKKVFAISAGWPGWARFGRDEVSALEGLLESGPRYAAVLKPSGLAFEIPQQSSEFRIIGRLDGNATTDFGAPDAQFPDEWQPMFPDEVIRSKTILKAAWNAFDQAAASAAGKVLQKGPRGGGRDLEKIIGHVVDAEEGYLRVLGVKGARVNHENLGEKKLRLREEAFKGLDLAAGGQLPRKGPRGGKRWPPRFYIRRVAWHAIDHAWEIEDRIIH